MYETIGESLDSISQSRVPIPADENFRTSDGGDGGPTGRIATEASEAGLAPASLLATTVNVYCDKFVRPGKVIGLVRTVMGSRTSAGVVRFCALTVYDCTAIGTDSGGDHDTTAFVLPPTAITLRGFVVSPVQSAVSVATVGALSPNSLTAITDTVYATPPVRPPTPTTRESASNSETIVSPSRGSANTLYAVIGVPPSVAGASHVTSALSLIAYALTESGLAGIVNGRIGLEGDDSAGMLTELKTFPMT